MITLGSLFDGSGGFPLAAEMCGIKTLWSSEIEPFPILVTSHRFPNVEQLGNICEMHGDEIEPVDIISFGSPCQDLSVAGKRAGLKGNRSILFLEAIRIIKEMREKTMENIQKSQFGKTSPELSVPTTARISELCSKNSVKLKIVEPQFLDLRPTEINLFGETREPFWERGIPLLGECSMHNFGAYPKDVDASSLWQILEVDVPQKYSLSETACRGILRRAQKREKSLPPLLYAALLQKSMTPEETATEKSPLL